MDNKYTELRPLKLCELNYYMAIGKIKRCDSCKRPSFGWSHCVICVHKGYCNDSNGLREKYKKLNFNE
jgi:hypothetical protein